MIDEIWAAWLLEGFRATVAADVGALIDTLVRASQLAVELGGPDCGAEKTMLMLPEGESVRAVDALWGSRGAACRFQEACGWNLSSV